jgi:hypothetical protein
MIEQNKVVNQRLVSLSYLLSNHSSATTASDPNLITNPISICDTFENIFIIDASLSHYA